MDQVGLEFFELIDYPLPVPAEQGIALQVLIEREGGPAPIQLQRSHGTLATGTPLRTGMDGAERKLTMAGEADELAA
jgi:hypothetical protein